MARPLHATLCFGLEGLAGIQAGGSHTRDRGTYVVDVGERKLFGVDLMAARSNVLYEPSIAIRIGRDPLKFTFDLGGAHNVSHPDLPMDNAVVAPGFVYTFKRR